MFLRLLSPALCPVTVDEDDGVLLMQNFATLYAKPETHIGALNHLLDKELGKHAQRGLSQDAEGESLPWGGTVGIVGWPSRTSMRC